MQEGTFRRNEKTGELYKCGKWFYYDKKFKYHKITFKDETYDDEGNKIEENNWGTLFQRRIVWKNGKKTETVFSDNLSKEIIITDLHTKDRESCVFDSQTGILVRKDVEKKFDEEKKCYTSSETFLYDGVDGKLLRCERKMPRLRNVYIIENYPRGKQPFFEYSEKHYGRYMNLYSSRDKKEVYQHYVSHLKLSKKDCVERRNVIKKLRELPSLKARKEFLRDNPFEFLQKQRGS